MSRLSVSNDVESLALKLYLERQTQFDPPPEKPKRFNWLPAEARLHIIVVIAALIVSAASTGPLFNRLESLFAHSGIAFFVAISAVLMLEIGFAANSYFEIHDNYRRQLQQLAEGEILSIRIPDVGKWARWGNFFPLSVVIVSNVYARFEIVSPSETLKTIFDLIIVILTGLAAPIQLEIASHIIGVLHVRSLEDIKQNDALYHEQIRDWNERYYKRFQDPRTYNDWVNKAAHILKERGENVEIVERLAVSNQPVYSDRQTPDRQTSRQKAQNSRQTNAQALVFAHLEQYPDDTELSLRELASRINESSGESVGKDSVKRYRDLFLAQSSAHPANELIN